GSTIKGVWGDLAAGVAGGLGGLTGQLAIVLGNQTMINYGTRLMMQRSLRTVLNDSRTYQKEQMDSAASATLATILATLITSGMIAGGFKGFDPDSEWWKDLLRATQGVVATAGLIHGLLANKKAMDAAQTQKEALALVGTAAKGYTQLA